MSPRRDDQRRSNAASTSDDLADLSLAVSRVAAVGEPHPDPLDQQRFQAGVVVLGRGDLVPEQRPTVQRQPPTVAGCRPCC